MGALRTTILLLLVALVGLVHGGVFNILDYGAIPSATTVAAARANSAAIGKAFQAVLTSGSRRPQVRGCLLLPPCEARPLLVHQPAAAAAGEGFWTTGALAPRSSP